MNDTLKWTLIGVGAWLLYQQYAATPAAIAATSGTPVTPPPTPAATPAATSTPTAAQAAAQQNLVTLATKGPNAILAAANVPATQLYTASQWNYYLPAIGVTYQPDLSNYGMNLTTAVTVTAWWAAVSAYFQAAANSSTGMGRLGVTATKKKLPLIPVTFDLQQTGW